MEEIKKLEIPLAFLEVASDARLCWHLFIYGIKLVMHWCMAK
jgi:hypothetical protein